MSPPSAKSEEAPRSRVGAESAAGPSASPYVSIAELAQRTPWTEEAIRRKMTRGFFEKGLHYHQPGGPRSQVVFEWAAVETLIRGERAPATDARPNAEGRIDLVEAAKQASRLLG